MRIVAVSAQQVGLVAVPVARAASVDPRTPVPQFLAVTLPAEAVGLLERYPLAAGEVEPVAVVGVVAVQAPAVFFVVLELNLGVHVRQNTPGPISFQIPVTLRTGEESLGEWRRRNFETLLLRSSPGLDAGFLGLAAPCRGPPKAKHHKRGETCGELSQIGHVQEQCDSIMRCISRIHIAWKSCSRWPTTVARLRVTSWPTSG